MTAVVNSEREGLIQQPRLAGFFRIGPLLFRRIFSGGAGHVLGRVKGGFRLRIERSAVACFQLLRLWHDLAWKVQERIGVHI